MVVLFDCFVVNLAVSKLKTNMNSKAQIHENRIKIYYSKDGYSLRISTDVAIKNKNEFSKKEGLLKPSQNDVENKKIQENNRVILSFREKVDNIINEYKKIYAEKPSVEYVKTQFKNSKNSLQQISNKQLGLLHWYKEFYKVKSKNAEIKPQSLKDYISTQNALIDFEKDTNKTYLITDINETFLNDFKIFLASPREEGKEYLTKGGLNNNTARKRFDCLRTYFRYLTFKVKLIEPNEEILKFKSADKYQIDFVSLTMDELQSLKDLKINEERLKKVRDIFLFGALTALRYSDIIRLDKVDFNFNAKEIRKTSEKTDDEFVIPILPTTAQIAKKMNYNFNHFSIQKFNDYLKELCEKYNLFQDEIKYTVRHLKHKEAFVYKRYELISSHTARRTFITNAIDKDMTIAEIKRITVHKKYDTLLKYINLSAKNNNSKMSRLNFK